MCALTDKAIRRGSFASVRELVGWQSTLGVLEAAEEAIYNAMSMATTVEGRRECYEAIAHDVVKTVLRRHRLMSE